MTSSSIMTVNPDITDAHVLRGWYDSVGVNSSFTAYSGSGPGGATTFNRADIRTIEDIKANTQIPEKAEMFSCRGTILHIKADNPAYPACQTCKKKVIDMGDSWRCEKCETSCEKPEYRCVVSEPIPEPPLTLSQGILFPWRSLITPGRPGYRVSMTLVWQSSTCLRMTSWKSRYVH